jgi:hypothetical protein
MVLHVLPARHDPRDAHGCVFKTSRAGLKAKCIPWNLLAVNSRSIFDCGQYRSALLSMDRVFRIVPYCGGKHAQKRHKSVKYVRCPFIVVTSSVFLVRWRCLAPRPGACVNIWDALWQLLSQSNSALHLNLYLIFSTYRISFLPSSKLLSVRMCHSKFRYFSTCCPSRTIGSMRFFVILSPFGWVTRISLSANISYAVTVDFAEFGFYN